MVLHQIITFRYARVDLPSPGNQKNHLSIKAPNLSLTFWQTRSGSPSSPCTKGWQEGPLILPDKVTR